jgi:hypothetical protein
MLKPEPGDVTEPDREALEPPAHVLKRRDLERHLREHGAEPIDERSIAPSGVVPPGLKGSAVPDVTVLHLGGANHSPTPHSDRN